MHWAQLLHTQLLLRTAGIICLFLPTNLHVQICLSMYLFCRYILASESGSIIIWEWPKRRVLFRAEQPIRQIIMLFEEDTKFLAASRLGVSNEGKGVFVVR